MTRGGGEKKGRKSGTKGENSKKSKTVSDSSKVTYRYFQTSKLLTLTRWTSGTSAWGPGTWQRTSVGRSGPWRCSTGARSPPQDTRIGNLRLKAPDTFLHCDTRLAHTCPAAGQTHIGHLGRLKQKELIIDNLFWISGGLATTLKKHLISAVVTELNGKSIKTNTRCPAQQSVTLNPSQDPAVYTRWMQMTAEKKILSWY